MKRKMNTVTLSIRLTALAVLFYGAAHGASGIWNGAESGYWTNSANWSAAYPSGGDTATFTNAGNGRTTVDLGGLSTIKSLAFDSASVASYTIGSGGANAQTLVTAGEGQISLSATAAADQTIAAAVQLPGNYTLANSTAARTLTLNNVTGTTADKSLTLNGTGAIAFLGNLSRGSNALGVNVNGT
jgi:hypothetical protein